MAVISGSRQGEAGRSSGRHRDGRVGDSHAATSESEGGVMRAIVQDAYGSADVLRLTEIERPEIAANQVLVKVRAAGVDRGTCHLMRGQPYLMRILGFGFRRPKTRVPGLGRGRHGRRGRLRCDQVPSRQRGLARLPKRRQLRTSQPSCSALAGGLKCW